MLLALSGNQKLGIALVAGAFIVFALTSSFLLPRRDPDFPGSRLRLFVGATALLTVGMLSAMVFLAREGHEEGEHREAPTVQVGP